MMFLDLKICCPKCSKFFHNQVQMQRHLDQPQSKCNQPNVQLMDPQDLLCHFKCYKVDAPRVVFSHKAFPTTHNESDSADLASKDAAMGLDSESDNTDSDIFTTDYFEGAAKVIDHNG